MGNTGSACCPQQGVWARCLSRCSVRRGVQPRRRRGRRRWASSGESQNWRAAPQTSGRLQAHPALQNSGPGGNTTLCFVSRARLSDTEVVASVLMLLPSGAVLWDSGRHVWGTGQTSTAHHWPRRRRRQFLRDREVSFQSCLVPRFRTASKSCLLHTPHLSLSSCWRFFNRMTPVALVTLNVSDSLLMESAV